MLNSFIFQIRISTTKIQIKFELHLYNVEKLKLFAFDVCTVGRDEGHSMHATRREAVYQQCNQPGGQAMSRSIAVH